MIFSPLYQWLLHARRRRLPRTAAANGRGEELYARCIIKIRIINWYECNADCYYPGPAVWPTKRLPSSPTSNTESNTACCLTRPSPPVKELRRGGYQLIIINNAPTPNHPYLKNTSHVRLARASVSGMFLADLPCMDGSVRGPLPPTRPTPP